MKKEVVRLTIDTIDGKTHIFTVSKEKKEFYLNEIAGNSTINIYDGDTLYIYVVKNISRIF